MLAAKIVLSGDARKTDRYPASLAGQVHLISQALAGTIPESRLNLPGLAAKLLKERRREQVQSLLGAGSRPTMMEAATRAEVAAALRLDAKHNLDTVLVAPVEFAFVASEIASNWSDFQVLK